MNDQDVLEMLEQWCQAYPEDIFTPLKGDPLRRSGDYSNKAKRSLITRASAAMGRHMVEKALKPACAEIRQLREEIGRIKNEQETDQ